MDTYQLLELKRLDLDLHLRDFRSKPDLQAREDLKELDLNMYFRDLRRNSGWFITELGFVQTCKTMTCDQLHYIACKTFI